MNRYNLLKGVLIFAFIAGCQKKQDEGAPVAITPVEIEDLELFLDYEEKGIVQPQRIEYSNNGQIIILDTKLRAVFVFNDEKELLTRFGGEGDGPGEFNSAQQMNISGDNIFVIDSELNRLNHFDVAGEFKSSSHFKDNSYMTTISAVSKSKYFAGSWGEEKSLIKLVDLDKDTIELLGEALGEARSVMNLEEERQSLANGKLPESYKNDVILYHTSQHLYAFLKCISRLQKYDLNCDMVWDAEIDLPINKILFDRVVERAKNAPEHVVPTFSYVTSMKVVNDEIYLLWYPAENQPRLLVKIDAEGKLAAIYDIPEEAPTYFDFSIDPENNRLYLTAPQLGQVYRVSLPE